MQMKADVTGRTVRSVLNPEPTALGAAMLAGIGAGIFRDAQDAADRVVRLSAESHDPDPQVAAVYEDAYGRYRLLFDAVESATT
jgi:xylulokinase